MFLSLRLAVLLAAGVMVAPWPDQMGEILRSVEETGRFVSHPQEQAAKIAHTAKYVQTLPDKSKEEQKTFTVEEVLQYDGCDGRPLYLIIDDVVYDFEELTQYHPAGPEVLQKHAGRDATTAVKASGMPSAAYRPLLHFFQVGSIVSLQKDNSTAMESAMKSLGTRLD